MGGRGKGGGDGGQRQGRRGWGAEVREEGMGGRGKGGGDGVT